MCQIPHAKPLRRIEKYATMKNVVSNIQNELKQLSNKEIAEHSQRFFKTAEGQYGYGDIFLGIRVPVLRKIAKKYSRTHPKTCFVTKSSEKTEAKAAGQKGSEAWLHTTLRTFLHRQRRHRALQPSAVERCFGVGSRIFHN